MPNDLSAMAVLVAVAEERSFRRAGERLGVSGSAVSQALRRFEERLGVTLAQRNTRSVHLTCAGEQLYAAARPALDELALAVTAASELGDEPVGRVRLHVATVADHFLAGPILADFLRRYPRVDLELFLSDAPVDIVGEGYDAGVQIGEVIDRDMIAVPVSNEIRLVVVGAPSYFAQHPRPQHPRELAGHECINWHPTPEAPPYRWEFTEDGREFSFAVRSRLLTNDPALNIRLARAGIGLTLASPERVQQDVQQGALEVVLDEFCTPFPGLFLYYPQRQHVSPALRALIDTIRNSARE